MYNALKKVKYEYFQKIKQETQNKLRILTLDITDKQLN